MEFFIFSFLLSLLPLAFFLLLGTILPSPRWVFAIICSGGVGLIWLWDQHDRAMQAPGYNEGPGGGLGIALVAMFTCAYAIAAVLYAAGLLWLKNRDEERGQSNDAATANNPDAPPSKANEP
jgi:drug/metabolite transporter (DMT)-like permease